MTKVNPSVDLTRDGAVAAIAMMAAPVNALEHEPRDVAVAGGPRAPYDYTVEIEGRDKPALIAETVHCA